MTYTLPNPVDFTNNLNAIYVGIQTFYVPFVYDTLDGKMVIAQTQFGAIVLWEAAEYDAIGDYTQVQIDDRIMELLAAGPVFYSAV